jgi:hypothetical protein
VVRGVWAEESNSLDLAKIASDGKYLRVNIRV